VRLREQLAEDSAARRTGWPGRDAPMVEAVSQNTAAIDAFQQAFMDDQQRQVTMNLNVSGRCLLQRQA